MMIDELIVEIGDFGFEDPGLISANSKHLYHKYFIQVCVTTYSDCNFQAETNGTSPRSLAKTDSEIQASKVSTPFQKPSKNVISG